MWAAVIAGALKVVGFGIDMCGQSEAEKASEKLTEQNVLSAQLDIAQLNNLFTDQQWDIRANRSEAAATINANAAAMGVDIHSGSVGTALVENASYRAEEESRAYKTIAAQQEAIAQEAVTASLAGAARSRAANINMAATGLRGASSLVGDYVDG